MRILVIIYEFPPIGGGGGRAALDISRELVQQRGHEVQVLTSQNKGLPRQETLDGIQINRTPAMRRSPYQADLRAMFGFVGSGIYAGLRLLRQWRPDVVHVHFAVPSGPVAWTLSRLSRIPYVLTVHLGDVPKGVPDKTDRWFRWIYPLTPPIWQNAAQLTAVSEHTRPVSYTTLPNGTLHRHPQRGKCGAPGPWKDPDRSARRASSLPDGW